MIFQYFIKIVIFRFICIIIGFKKLPRKQVPPLAFKFFSSTDEKLVTTVQDSSNINEQIQVSVDQLNAVVEQIKLATVSLEDISSSNQKTMQQLKEHSEKTNDNTQKVKEKMLNIQSSSIEVSTISDQVLKDSLSSTDDIKIAFSALQALHTKITTLHNNHQELLQQMDSLVRHSNKTIEIVNTIGSISQKTRVLALNASIEAARAGVHGKGFDVVANEVGKLANLTSDAVNETSENIQLIQEEIRKTTNLVNEESSQVEAGANEITYVLESFQTMQNKLNHIQASISDTNNAVGSQTENITEITSLLNDISHMSVENTEQVFQVSKDLTSQHASIEQILKITTSLTNTSNELEHLVNKDESSNIQVDYDSSLIEKIKTALMKLLDTSQLHNLDENNHAKTLDAFLHMYQDLEAIWSNRSDGTFICSFPPAGLINAKVRPWFDHAIKGEIYVSDIYTSALTKKKCITISCPISYQNKIFGVIGVDLSLTRK